jgi:hypothetical protein
MRNNREKAEEPKSVWRALVTEDGVDYYMNTETNETTWDKPTELMTDEVFFPCIYH